jgi:hypothetical protein
MSRSSLLALSLFCSPCLSLTLCVAPPHLFFCCIINLAGWFNPIDQVIRASRRSSLVADVRNDTGSEGPYIPSRAFLHIKRMIQSSVMPVDHFRGLSNCPTGVQQEPIDFYRLNPEVSHRSEIGGVVLRLCTTRLSLFTCQFSRLPTLNGACKW